MTVQTYPCALCGGPISTADWVRGELITVNVDGHGRTAHRKCPAAAGTVAVCRHCGDGTEPGDDPAPDLCAMCAKAGRTSAAPAVVTLPREVVEKLIRLAGLAVTEHTSTERKISEQCTYDDEDCDRSEHPNCGTWAGFHSESCRACEPIKAARAALGA